MAFDAPCRQKKGVKMGKTPFVYRTCLETKERAANQWFYVAGDTVERVDALPIPDKTDTLYIVESGNEDNQPCTGKIGKAFFREQREAVTQAIANIDATISKLNIRRQALTDQL
jgi:predicted phosphodiesterase